MSSPANKAQNMTGTWVFVPDHPQAKLAEETCKIPGGPGGSTAEDASQPTKPKFMAPANGKSPVNVKGEIVKKKASQLVALLPLVSRASQTAKMAAILKKSFTR